jgi:hypothetical protein
VIGAKFRGEGLVASMFLKNRISGFFESPWACPDSEVLNGDEISSSESHHIRESSQILFQASELGFLYH